MSIRDNLQKIAVEKYVNKGIYWLCPRFGKIKTTFLLCEKQKWWNILIIAPRKDIFEGWSKDEIKFEFQGNISFCTFTSIDKIDIPENIDLIVIDEIHEASANQLEKIGKLIKNKNSLGLTGTMTNKTQQSILSKTQMKACHKYTIAEGIRDGILADYILNIHNVDLDNINRFVETKKGKLTEKERFNQLTWLKNKLLFDNKPVFFIDLKIINLLQNSEAKKEKTISLLNSNKEKRILVFCGTTETADNLGINVYHSKSKEKKIFNSFCNGEGSHLATVKMMQAGVTILPISLGIINYTSGNPEDAAQKICRFLGMEYDNLEKKAEIHIICSNTTFEKSRLETALMFFDESKIINA